MLLEVFEGREYLGAGVVQAGFLKEWAWPGLWEKERIWQGAGWMTSQGCSLPKVSLILQDPDAIFAPISTSLTRDRKARN